MRRGAKDSGRLCNVYEDPEAGCPPPPLPLTESSVHVPLSLRHRVQYAISPVLGCRRQQRCAPLLTPGPKVS